MPTLTVLLAAIAIALPCAAEEPCPPPSAQNVVMTHLGSNSGCTSFGGSYCYFGELVTFEARAFAYTFCPGQEFLWSFGDGTTGTGPQVAHAWPLAGVYQVELTLSVLQAAPLRLQQLVEVGPHGDPPAVPRRRGVRH